MPSAAAMVMATSDPLRRAASATASNRARWSRVDASRAATTDGCAAQLVDRPGECLGVARKTGADVAFDADGRAGDIRAEPPQDPGRAEQQDTRRSQRVRPPARGARGCGTGRKARWQACRRWPNLTRPSDVARPRAGCRGGLSRSARRGCRCPPSAFVIVEGARTSATHAHSCPETSDQARRPPRCRQLAGRGAAVHRGSHVQDSPGRAHRRWHVPGGAGAEPGCPGRARRRSRPARERDGRRHLAARASGRPGQFPVRARHRRDRRIGAHVHPQGRHAGGDWSRRNAMPARSNATRCAWRCCVAPRAPTSTCSCRGTRRLRRRFLRLGAFLLAIYLLSGALYLAVIVAGYRAVGEDGFLVGWTVIAALCSAVLVAWLALVNTVVSGAAGDRGRPRPLGPGRGRGGGAPGPGRPDAHARRVPRDGRSRGRGHAGVDRRDRGPWTDLVRAVRRTRRAAAAVARVAAARTGVPVPRAHVSGRLPVPLRCPARAAPKAPSCPGECRHDVARVVVLAHGRAARPDRRSARWASWRRVGRT